MTIIDKLDKKKILVWGFGKEGRSTKKFLDKYCKNSSIEIFEGKKEDINEDNFDVIIKSPGIIMDGDNPKYTSQTQLFLEEFRDKTIGVTGTKGKSTTSAMLHKVLKDCTNKKVLLLGNIGEPPLDYFKEIDDDTIIVFEMSSHQLSHITVSPHIAVFLNFYEEHLDYYKTIDNYFRAKERITKYQKDNDFLFLGNNIENIKTKAKVIKIKETTKEYPLKLIGTHNKYNAEFVYRITKDLFDCKKEDILKSLESFKGLSHRLEYIGDFNEVSFYDDSISTIPKATIEAIKGIKNIQTIIVGGMDRGIDYSLLIEFINNNKDLKFVLMYDSGKRIFNEIMENKNCYYVKDLEEAVSVSKKITDKSKACLLSPASASYGYFNNFEERGKYFKKFVFDDNE